MFQVSKPDDWCCAVFVFGPDNTMVWVKDVHEYGESALLKAAGGRRKKPGEASPNEKRVFDRTPLETAIWELEEETGLTPDKLYPLPQYTEERERYGKPHTAYFYVAFVDSFDGLKERGNEGELVVVRDIADDIWPPEMIPAHYPILQDLLRAARDRAHELALAMGAQAAA